MKPPKQFSGSITWPDGREYSVVFKKTASGPSGRLIITDPDKTVVYDGFGESQSDAVLNFYNWFRDKVRI